MHSPITRLHVGAITNSRAGGAFLFAYLASQWPGRNINEKTPQIQEKPLDDEELQTEAERIASDLPETTRSQPFGPDYEVFKVAGKVFMMTTEVPGKRVVTLKCEPPHGEALRQNFDGIVPGYHMNKRHWISIEADDRMTDELLEELVQNSYLLVLEGLPRSKRPVDPSAFTN
jgi:predicted DNA-binding protein (MmcQ/YjbR family)